jgi:hypothetical protein
MKEILQKMAMAAKANLLKDGDLATVTMWFKNKALIAGPQLPVNFKLPTADENKDMNILTAGYYAKQIEADYIVFIWDGAMRIIDPSQPMILLSHPSATQSP